MKSYPLEMDVSSCLRTDENKWFKDDELGCGVNGNFEMVDASRSPTIDVEDTDSPFQHLHDPAHSKDIDVDSECPLQFLSEFEPDTNDIFETKAPEKKRRKRKGENTLQQKINTSNEEVDDLVEEIQDEDGEIKDIRTRFKQGCDCEDSNCFDHLDPRSVYRHRLNITELTKPEHDMYLMGLIKACISCNQTSKNKERQRLRSHYFYQGKKVCLTAFLFLENCTRYQLKAMRCHLMSHGVTPRVHGNQGKRPHNVFSLETYNQVSEFLKKFFEETSAGSGYGRTPLSISLDHTTRKHLHDRYIKQYKSIPNERLMGYSTFLDFMKHQFPHVKFVKQDSLSKLNKEILNRDKIIRQNPAPIELYNNSSPLIRVSHESSVVNTDTNHYEIVMPQVPSELLNGNEAENIESCEVLDNQMVESNEMLDNENFEIEVLENEIIEDQQISSTQVVMNSENHSPETQNQIENEEHLVLSIENDEFVDGQNPTYIMTPNYTSTNQRLLYLIR